MADLLSDRTFNRIVLAVVGALFSITMWFFTSSYNGIVSRLFTTEALVSTATKELAVQVAESRASNTETKYQLGFFNGRIEVIDAVQGTIRERLSKVEARLDNKSK